MQYVMCKCHMCLSSCIYSHMYTTVNKMTNFIYNSGGLGAATTIQTEGPVKFLFNSACLNQVTPKRTRFGFPNTPSQERRGSATHQASATAATNSGRQEKHMRALWSTFKRLSVRACTSMLQAPTDARCQDSTPSPWLPLNWQLLFTFSTICVVRKKQKFPTFITKLSLLYKNHTFLLQKVVLL